MKKEYTHISVVLDRSGSMQSMVSDVVGGFDRFVEDQKKEKGECTLSLVQFDDVYETVHDFINIQDMKGMRLFPNGSTALYDAMGKTLEETREKVKSMKDEESPSKVIFVFITDGGENASNKYNRNEIFAMIKDLKSPERGDEINWEFVFIGANQDAMAEGSSYGINTRSSMTFDASGAGATAAFHSLSKGISSFRCCVEPSAAYSFAEEDYNTQDALIAKKAKKSKKA